MANVSEQRGGKRIPGSPTIRLEHLTADNTAVSSSIPSGGIVTFPSERAPSRSAISASSKPVQVLPATPQSLIPYSDMQQAESAGVKAGVNLQTPRKKKGCLFWFAG